jgi:uncharacterized glyoxalase superfamily protein PhnB/DNA-binding XRE family transcriptional regulator
MDMKPAGSRIRELRERRAWTQERLAEVAAISPRTVQRAEEGVMAAQTLSAIASALEVDVDALSAPSQPPASPRISPSLFYRDADAAIAFLDRAFGFRPRLRVPGPGDTVMHCELVYEDGVIMLASADDQRKSPAQLGGAYTQGLYVLVEDIDAHYARAKRAGAAIVRELKDEDYGHRSYHATDTEGHRWGFGKVLR